MRRALERLAPAMLLIAGACVATASDVDALRASVNDLRAQAAHSDSVREAQVGRAAADLAAVDDSVRALSARVARMNGDVRGDLYAIGQQLIQIQELTGQSQRRLQELRASMEQRQAELAAPAPAPASGAVAAVGAGAAGAAASPGGTTPGPNELFQLSLDQLRRGSAATARNGLMLLVQKYPQAELVPDAQFYIAESWAAEGNAGAADSAYAVVVMKYPKSGRAPTALYKRAMAMEARGNHTAARAAFTQLVQAYPRSDEAALAREQLRAIP
jgi:tol-pal system protein YbgF